MIAIDASVLIEAFNSSTSEESRARLAHYFKELDKQKIRVIVPSPAFCEFVGRARQAASAYVEIIGLSKAIEIAPFGVKAAIECAIMLRDGKTPAGKREEGVTWAKAKFDWQIVAIAKSEGAEEILTHDKHIHALCKRVGLTSRSVMDLLLPNSARQRPLPLSQARSDTRRIQ